MRYKGEKRYLTVSGSEVNRYIEYIMVARNTYIESGKPVENVNDLLGRFLKLKRKLHA